MNKHQVVSNNSTKDKPLQGQLTHDKAGSKYLCYPVSGQAKEANFMSIKSAIHSTGIPIKIIPFSPEMITSAFNHVAFQDILSARINALFNSHVYIEKHKEFKDILNDIETKTPEFKKAINEIDDIVVSKEIQCFDAGYEAGMTDLMTALTFNDLQITHTQLINLRATDEQSKV